jgi:uncharacterized protein (TIGR02284 family)
MIGSSADIRTLNGLIATTVDSIRGYQEAASEAENSRFRELFQHFAQDRQRIVTELQAEVGRLGGKPEDDGTLAGAAHRGWLDLKSALTGHDDRAIVNEVERGEDHIKGKFEQAMRDTDLSAETRRVIEHCYTSVRQGHDRMRDLKHGLQRTESI